MATNGTNLKDRSSTDKQRDLDLDFRVEMKLYIKNGCPWCVMAEAWLDRRGMKYESIDVLIDPVAFQEMKRVSGQTKAPVLLLQDGRVLSDFGPEELPGFLNHQV
jgi:glutaredoxin